MRWVRCMAVGVGVLAGLAGCESVDQPELATLDAARSTGVTVPAPQLASADRVVQSVTGSGHFDVGGELRTFSFTARKAADGTVSGEWEAFNRIFIARAHGSINCFTIVGNQAWIGGILEQSDDPSLVGLAARWRVVDNGEGSNTPADQISQIPLGAPAGAEQVYCANTPAFPVLNNVEEGNIQIRP